MFLCSLLYSHCLSRKVFMVVNLYYDSIKKNVSCQKCEDHENLYHTLAQHSSGKYTICFMHILILKFYKKKNIAPNWRSNFHWYQRSQQT